MCYKIGVTVKERSFKFLLDFYYYGLLLLIVRWFQSLDSNYSDITNISYYNSLLVLAVCTPAKGELP